MKQRTILIVDDDELFRTSLNDCLTSQGYHVITAQDGIEAFNELMLHRPDLILIDKVMPHFDGFEFCNLVNRIRKYHAIPIILMSGQMKPGDEEEAMKMGFSDYLPKPIDEDTLLRRIRWALVFSDRMRSSHRPPLHADTIHDR